MIPIGFHPRLKPGLIVALSVLTGLGIQLVSPVEAELKPLSGGVSQEVYGLSDDLDTAEAQVKAHPDDPEAWFLMAVAYSRTPYVERALEALDRSRRLAKKSPEGFALFDRKIAEYEHLLSKTPNDPLVLYRLGFGYYMRGYAVTQGYMKATAGSPPASQYFDRAENTFRQLVRQNPADTPARNYLGFLLAEREPERNYDTAVALWQESIHNDPDDPAAYMLMGQAALKKGDLRRMAEYSVQGIKLRNAWLEAHRINPDTVKVRL